MSCHDDTFEEKKKEKMTKKTKQPANQPILIVFEFQFITSFRRTNQPHNCATKHQNTQTILTSSHTA